MKKFLALKGYWVGFAFSFQEDFHLCFTRSRTGHLPATQIPDFLIMDHGLPDLRSRLVPDAIKRCT